MYFALFATEDDPLITVMYVINILNNMHRSSEGCYSGVVILDYPETNSQLQEKLNVIFFFLHSLSNDCQPRCYWRKWISIREFKQTQGRRLREWHMKMLLRVSAIIQSRFACKMCSKYPRFRLEPALCRDEKAKLNICHRTLTSSTQLHTTGHFMSWKERELLRNVQKWKMHVQSEQNCCFSL